jgi:hypothetical protein
VSRLLSGLYNSGAPWKKQDGKMFYFANFTKLNDHGEDKDRAHPRPGRSLGTGAYSKPRQYVRGNSPGPVVHACNPSSPEAETGESQIQGYIREFKANLGNLARPWLKNFKRPGGLTQFQSICSAYTRPRFSPQYHKKEGGLLKWGNPPVIEGVT